MINGPIQKKKLFIKETKTNKKCYKTSQQINKHQQQKNKVD